MGLELEYADGATPINEAEKAGLLIKTIGTIGELNEYEQLNIERALIWIHERKFTKEQILTEKFIKQLHKRMYGLVWKWAGEFRRSEKNIGIDWVNIPVELNKLLSDILFWIENETYPPDEIAIRSKHRLVSIHCFPNGNGRHSRVMADNLIESVFHRTMFTWQESMVRPNETRKEYIQALQEADRNNYAPLIKFARS